MEVYVLERYYLPTEHSEILGVFENADVAMNTVNYHEDIMWDEYDDCWMSNNVDNIWMINNVDSIRYFLYRFDVVLDEMPRVQK